MNLIDRKEFFYRNIMRLIDGKLYMKNARSREFTSVDYEYDNVNYCYQVKKKVWTQEDIKR